MNDDLKLKVGLEDKATAGLKELERNIKSFASDVARTGSAAQATSASFGKLTASLISANLIVSGIVVAFGAVKDAFDGTIAAANRYNAAMLGLNSTAASFGINQQKAREAAQSLAKDGLINVATASKGLQQLFAGGMGLEQATDLMNAYKDQAALGRVETLTMDQAVGNLAESFITEMSNIGNLSGQHENYSLIVERGAAVLGKTVSQLTQAERAQAKYIGTMQLAEIVQGDAARAAELASTAQSRFENQVFNLQASIGQALSPAVVILIEGLTQLVGLGNESVSPMLNGIAKGMAFLATVAVNVASTIMTHWRNLANVIGTVAGAMSAAVKGDFEGASKAIKGGFNNALDIREQGQKAITDSWKKFGDTVKKIDTEGLGSFPDIFKQRASEIPEAISNAAKKAAEQIEKLNRDFQNKMASMARDFDENLRDMVIGHRDKLKTLQKQEDEEKASFNKLMDERKKQLEKETQAMEDAIQKVNDKYKDSLIQFKKAGEERLASLQVQLDRERAEGRYADSEKVKSLEDMLSRERVSLEEQEKVKQGLIQEEIDEVVKTHQERIDELKNETAEIQSEHDKRLGALQAEINAEREIQRKYAEDFAKFQNAVAEDDITRLKRKYAEQRAEEERQHNERLMDIARRVSEERTTASAGQVRGGGQNFSQAASDLTKKSQQTSKSVSLGIVPSVSNLFSSPVKSSSAMRRFGDGGIVERPTFAQIGEDGPEAVVPLGKPHRAAQILQQAGVGSGITIHAPITVVSSEVDIDRLVERLAFKLDKSGLL